MHYRIQIRASLMKQVPRDPLMLRKIFSRRKHSRYHTNEKTFIIFQPFTPDEQKLQIIDISEGGCAFIYTGEERDLEAMTRVNLMSEGLHQHNVVNGIHLSKVTDRRVSGPFRRRGVEFMWLGAMDREKLKKFIDEVSLCKC